MRRAARVDGTQAEIVAALRAVGASVLLLHTVGQGCPDILVGYRGRSLLMELKSKGGKLNAEQARWCSEWRGEPVYVCDNVKTALKALGVIL